MISTTRLRANLVEDRVVFDENGDPLDAEIPAGAGPALFLVAPVTDAVKRVDVDEVKSADRDQFWVVEALVLREEVLSRLGDEDMSTEALLAAVRELGYDWAVSPIADP